MRMFTVLSTHRSATRPTRLRTGQCCHTSVTSRDTRCGQRIQTGQQRKTGLEHKPEVRQKHGRVNGQLPPTPSGPQHLVLQTGIFNNGHIVVIVFGVSFAFKSASNIGASTHHSRPRRRLVSNHSLRHRTTRRVHMFCQCCCTRVRTHRNLHNKYSFNSNCVFYFQIRAKLI